MNGVLAVALLTLAGGENRAWFVELEVRGPLEEVVLDAGPDGATRVRGPWRAGELQRLEVPVPVRSPLGGAGLSAVPVPVLRTLPADGAGAVTSSGWITSQPDEAHGRLSPGLRSRPRPPGTLATARAGGAALGVALVGTVLAALLGRRRLLAPAAGLVAGFAAGGLVLAGASPPVPVEVLEGEVGAPRWVQVTGARGGLEARLERLEVRPAGRRLDLELEARSPELVGVRAPGALLHAIRLVAPPSAGSGENPHGALDEVWVRDPRGSWTAHGPWLPGAPLPATGGAPGTAPPPGWLAAGLPPGTGVLLGRFAAGDGRWLRVSGFDPERD